MREYVIRFRDCILVEDEKGRSRPGAGWVAPRGRALMLPNARGAADRAPRPAAGGAAGDEEGRGGPGPGWVAPRGRAVMLPNARVTADRAPVPAVVVVHAARM